MNVLVRAERGEKNMGIPWPCFAVNFASGGRIVKDVTTSAVRIDSTDGIVANVNYGKL